MFKYVFLSVFLLFFGCDDEVQPPTNEIIDALQSGEIIVVDTPIDADGIIAVKKSAVTTGCFGFAWCVRMDETNRGIIKKSIDDFSVYAESTADEPPTGVTYFSSDFYGPYWATNGTYTAMRALITAGGGDYPGKRIGWCNNHPERCVQ